MLAALGLRLVRHEIAEESMVPALRPGDWVLGVRRPQRLRTGDVVVFDLRPGFEVVKRVSPPPAGTHGLWLLGDNPAAGSVDSRMFGPVSADRIKSRLLLRYQPRPVQAIPPPPGS
ncbi:MAG: S26 family signal peptidase [Actinomycetota bacterium]|nr:S26 family signal peptidase [Actinomycetota bacterium]